MITPEVAYWLGNYHATLMKYQRDLENVLGNSAPHIWIELYIETLATCNEVRMTIRAPKFGTYRGLAEFETMDEAQAFIDECKLFVEQISNLRLDGSLVR